LVGVAVTGDRDTVPRSKAVLTLGGDKQVQASG
jgi:hypothetical protein